MIFLQDKFVKVIHKQDYISVCQLIQFAVALIPDMSLSEFWDVFCIDLIKCEIKRDDYLTSTITKSQEK